MKKHKAGRGAGVNYPRIMNAFNSHLWAILPEKLEEIRAFLEAKSRGEDIAAERIADIHAARRSNSSSSGAPAGVGIVPIMGVLSQRVSLLEESSGGVSTEKLGVQLDELVADSAVGKILLLIDSPGGSVYGTPELAEKIRLARGKKEIIAQVDSLGASAAYWLASQASRIVLTPGGQVGSIGVIVTHADISRALDREGIKVTTLTSSKYKAEGNEYEPLGDEARAEIQARINDYHQMFVDAVAKGRGKPIAEVNTKFGQGRVLTAQQALRVGMVDEVGTFQNTLSSLRGKSTATRGAGAKLVTGGIRSESAQQVTLPATTETERAPVGGPRGDAAMAAARVRALEVTESFAALAPSIPVISSGPVNRHQAAARAREVEQRQRGESVTSDPVNRHQAATRAREVEREAAALGRGEVPAIDAWMRGDGPATLTIGGPHS